MSPGRLRLQTASRTPPNLVHPLEPCRPQPALHRARGDLESIKRPLLIVA